MLMRSFDGNASLSPASSSFPFLLSPVLSLVTHSGLWYDMLAERGGLGKFWEREIAMFRPEPLDIVLILLIGVLLFGANRLPETARALGKGIREFRDAIAGKGEKATEASERDNAEKS
jgi:sec-independent protein translocase protein TatA